MYWGCVRGFKLNGAAVQGYGSDSGQYSGHHVLEVGEDVSVGQVLVRCDKFAINVDVEHTVRTGNQVEFGDVLAGSTERLARHPGGAQGVASMLAVLQAYLESVGRHVPTSGNKIG